MGKMESIHENLKKKLINFNEKKVWNFQMIKIKFYCKK